MGIAGLLPLLKPVSIPVNIKTLSGKTVAVDAYCWLHKGAFGCPLELVQGKATDTYIKFCMKRISLMVKYNVTPYLVFDGAYLPSKACKETERAERRSRYRIQGMEYLREGKRAQAIECFQKCVDITPAIALGLIEACKLAGIKFVVAPYEADAQLAFLAKAGLCDAIITEDSDLLVFGCNRLIYKMDQNGEGIEVRSEYLHADLSPSTIQLHDWPFSKIRQLCILSGCDYLPSVSGVGLKNAYKYLRDYGDVERAIEAIKCSYSVPKDYSQQFKQAEATFLYQKVWDPVENKLTTLHPIPGDQTDSSMDFAGPLLPHELAEGIATGLVDPITKLKFTPQELQTAKQLATQCRLSAFGPTNTQSTTLDRFFQKTKRPTNNVADLKKESEAPEMTKPSKQGTMPISGNPTLKRSKPNAELTFTPPAPATQQKKRPSDGLNSKVVVRSKFFKPSSKPISTPINSSAAGSPKASESVKSISGNNKVGNQEIGKLPIRVGLSRLTRPVPMKKATLDISKFQQPLKTVQPKMEPGPMAN
eukprot:m.255754 g.255754  ORF g.255754 m.255754 type:complete len:534 (-) comp16184_c0_seq25:3009-4610(-)